MKNLFLVFLLLTTVACSDSYDDIVEDSSSDKSSNPTENSFEQLASGELILSFDEEEAFWEFINLQSEWNYFAGIFTEAYLDDNVGIEEFLEIGIYSYNELFEIYNKMATSFSVFKAQVLIDMFSPALNNYYKKINALYTILEGVDLLDVEIEERGLLLLSEAGEESQKIACDLFKELNSETIRNILQPTDLEKLDSLSNVC